jgi:hypothetical protein
MKKESKTYAQNSGKTTHERENMLYCHGGGNRKRAAGKLI